VSFAIAPVTLAGDRAGSISPNVCWQVAITVLFTIAVINLAGNCAVYALRSKALIYALRRKALSTISLNVRWKVTISVKFIASIVFGDITIDLHTADDFVVDDIQLSVLYLDCLCALH
jgi:hypothetical protein